MYWPRLIVLLLLPVGLGGCWELSTRTRAPATASSDLYGLSAPASEDLPTPRLFQLQHAPSPAE
jgi:hypothetical protein